MKTKIVLTMVALVVIGGIIAAVLFTSASPVEMASSENAAKPTPPVVASPSDGTTGAAPEKVPVSIDRPMPPPVSEARGKSAKTADKAQADAPIIINGYELQDPLARIALNDVGSDPEADAYWIGAINDDSMPAEERKDLIEDLNEDGLSDPRHPGAQDLPLIMSRIRLIEQLMPTAMDSVNRDAFAEAYKDLVGLANGQAPQ